jgi:hypothetical protein
MSAIKSVSVALDVLHQAAVEGVFIDPIPSHHAAQIAAADQVVTTATEAWRQHVRTPDVIAILAVAFELLKPATAPAIYSDVREAEKSLQRAMGGRA